MRYRRDVLRILIISAVLILLGIVLGTLVSLYAPRWIYNLLLVVLMVGISFITSLRIKSTIRERKGGWLFTLLLQAFSILSSIGAVAALILGYIGAGALFTGLALVALIAGKAGVFIWTAAVLPALKAVPAVFSGYYLKKWLDERGKKKNHKPPAPSVPIKGKEPKDSQAAERETERELL